MEDSIARQDISNLHNDYKEDYRELSKKLRKLEEYLNITYQVKEGYIKKENN